jgi:hypothetical protein
VLALTSVRSLAEDGDGSDECDPDGQPMKVHKCDGHGKVDCVLGKSMCRRMVQIFGAGPTDLGRVSGGSKIIYLFSSADHKSTIL